MTMAYWGPYGDHMLHLQQVWSCGLAEEVLGVANKVNAGPDLAFGAVRLF